jgi:sugar phosphate permease
MLEQSPRSYTEVTRSKYFYGWYIVVACMIITLYTSGTIGFGFTAIFEPIAGEFGWSYASISFAGSLRGFAIGLLAPVAGILVDRWGPRKLVFGGGIFICIGFLLLGRTSSLAMFYVAYTVVALGFSGCSQTVLMTAVNNWFRRKAGLAIGIVSTGFSLGGLMVPVLTRLIDKLQWRMAMIITGLVTLVIILPLSLIIRRKPEDYGYRPDGMAANIVRTRIEQTSVLSEEASISAKEAFRNRAFWHLTISSIFFSFVQVSVSTHLMPYFSSLGITRSFSSMIAFIIPLVSIGGRISSGWLAGKLGSKSLLTASFISTTIGLILFEYVRIEMMWLLVPIVITFGFVAWGYNMTTRVYLQREYFGRDAFGKIYGLLAGFMMIGQITGPPLVGWVFDTWGSYQGSWLGLSALAFMGAILIISMPSPLHQRVQSKR